MLRKNKIPKDKEKAYMKEEEIALKMKQFETMINTADKSLADELIASDASFYTPASPEPVFGGDGYLSVVYFMRKGFSDVQWKLEEIQSHHLSETFENIMRVANYQFMQL